MASSIPADRIETRHYINGAFSTSSDNGTFKVINPYTQEKVADVFEATEDDTDRAVAAAKAAFPSWSATSLQTRGTRLKKLAKLITEATQELMYLDAVSMGRPAGQYFDAAYAAASFEHFAEANWEAMQGKTSLNTPGFVNMSFRQPIGPTAFIVPWNVPLVMIGKIAPALAAGCTVVLKSSEKAPLSAAKVAHLVHEAGFPAGVVNILSGHGMPCGSTLASHMDIRCLDFTGSGATGKKVQQAAAASNLKKVILELGGKSPALIFDDADLHKAAAETAFSIQFNQGQACIANSRNYVQDTIAEKFTSTFTAIMRGAKKGVPLLPETQQGPQVDEIQYERIKAYLKTAKEGKGKLELGGGVTAGPNGKGYFIEPTVYSNVPEDDKTQREEVFGPFVSINTFSTEAEAIEKANDTEYGLYASVYTSDISRALRVAKAFESGIVGINCTSPTVCADMPVGGYKQSGQGREGFGYALEEYLEHKTVLIKVGDLAAAQEQTRTAAVH